MLKIKEKVSPFENKGTIRSKKVIDIALRLASDKAEDTVVYDIHNKTPFVNYAIVTTATSSRRLKSLTSEASDALIDNKFVVNHIEGNDESLWMLVDGGQVVVQVFTPEERERVKLDELYVDCPHKVITEKDVKEYLTANKFLHK